MYIVQIFFIVILLVYELLIPVLANSFSLEFERQKVSSTLQDSSQYSSRS